MEREVFLTGIGGQGVQLAARILALAATAEGRHVMSLGVYGGTMRGGDTDSTVVIADRPITAPPIVSRGWAAVVVHPRSFARLRAKLSPQSVVVYDPSLAKGEFELDLSGCRGFAIEASALARDAGAARATSLVLLGGFCAATQLVAASALVTAMRESLPSYRQQHADSNELALRAGYAALAEGVVHAWATEESAA